MNTLKQNDTGIGLKATLSNNNGNVNLTSANVLFLFGKHEIVPLVTNKEQGELLIVFEEIHTRVPGIYLAEFKVTFPDGRRETFPNDGYIKIHIKEGLGGR